MRGRELSCKCSYQFHWDEIDKIILREPLKCSGPFKGSRDRIVEPVEKVHDADNRDYLIALSLAKMFFKGLDHLGIGNKAPKDCPVAGKGQRGPCFFVVVLGFWIVEINDLVVVESGLAPEPGVSLESSAAVIGKRHGQADSFPKGRVQLMLAGQRFNSLPDHAEGIKH